MDRIGHDEAHGIDGEGAEHPAAAEGDALRRPQTPMRVPRSRSPPLPASAIIEPMAATA